MKIDLSNVGQREQLPPKPNRSAYWDRLRPGVFVGYRPAGDGADGTWAARVLVGRDYEYLPLDTFSQHAPKERFAKAKAAAEAFAAKLENGGQAVVVVDTVADAAREYAKAHPDADRFFRRNVYEDPIGKLKLKLLTHGDLADWRKRLEERPLQGGNGSRKAAEVRQLHAAGVKPAEIAKRLGIARPSAYRILAAPSASAAPRLRKKSSTNREMTPLRAALYAKLPPGPPSKANPPWQDALAKYADAKQPRERVLEKHERKLLLDHCSDEIRPFVRGLCLLPVRVGLLSKITVSDFNSRTATLNVRAGIDKGHPTRKVPLSPAAVELLAEQARDKHPATLLFLRDDRTGWTADTWQDPIRDAAAAAGFEPGVTAYTLRHSTITDLVADGTDLFTVSKISGTSVKEIEETYAHLKSDVARNALQSLAL